MSAQPTQPPPTGLAPGLQLDARQRAMLAEMKIPFWWPASAADAAPNREPAAAGAGVPDLSPVAGTNSAAAQPAAHVPAPVDPDTALAVAHTDWAQLRAAVQSCTACGRCAGRKAPVFVAEPQPRQVDWLVVGEPPDEEEERAGAPFAGNAGTLLDNMLRAVRVSRDGNGSAGARLTPVVKCRPAAAHNPTPEELAQCGIYLRREIALAQPRVIVAMGRFAAVSVLGADHPELLQLPFGQMRGKVYRSLGVAVVVTYHPSKLLRAPAQKAQVWADLCLALAQTQPTPSASSEPP